MKIIRSSKRENTHFQFINCGDVFIDEDDTCCLKVEINDSSNAIRLVNGVRLFFDEDDKVYVCNAHLTVE